MNYVKILLIVLAIYIPLEEFILKWLPVNVATFEYLHLTSDLMIALILLLFSYISRFTFFLKSEIKWAIFFFISTLFGLLVYQEWTSYFFKIWVLLRYVIVYYIIITSFNRKDFIKFYKVFYFVFYFQIFVGVIQFFEINILQEIFHPREGLGKASNWLVKEETGLAGTFQFTVQYGYFFFVSSLFVIIDKGSLKKKFFLIFVCILFSYLSDSMMSFLCSLILGYLFIISSIDKNKRLSLTFFMILVFSIMLLINVDKIRPLIEISVSLGSEFIYGQLMFSRLGVLKVFPAFLDADLYNIFFGFSINENLISNFIEKNISYPMPSVLKNNVLIGLEDVYWSAHLYYFGLIGIVSYFLIIYSIRNKVLILSYFSSNKAFLNKIKSVINFLSLTLAAAFINQIFSFKTFMVYFFFGIAYTLSAEGFYLGYFGNKNFETRKRLS